jgi:hypothetical protein
MPVFLAALILVIKNNQNKASERLFAHGLPAGIQAQLPRIRHWQTAGRRPEVAFGASHEKISASDALGLNAEIAETTRDRGWQVQIKL